MHPLTSPPPSPDTSDAACFYRHGDRIHGPASVDDLRAALVLGFLSPDDPIRIGPGSGWVPARTLPQLRPSAEPASSRGLSRSRAGFTLLEVLVLVLATALFVAALLPAISQAREASRRGLCADRQRLLAQAVLEYHDAHGAFPTGVGYEQEGSGCASDGGRSTWMMRILPSLGHDDVAERIAPDSRDGNGIDGRAADADTRRALQTTIPAFLCPSDTHSPVVRRTADGSFWDSYSQSNLVGCFSPHGFFVEPEADRACLVRSRMDGGQATTANPTVLAEDPLETRPGRSVFNFSGVRRTRAGITDGTANTVMISEVIAGSSDVAVLVDLRGSWWSDTGSAYSHWHLPNDPRPDHHNHSIRVRSAKRGVPDVVAGPGGWPATMTAARSRHPGGVNTAFADGSTRFITDPIDPDVWIGMGSMNGAEP